MSTTLVIWSSAEAYFSSTELSKNVMASLSFAKSIYTAFFVPYTLNVSLLSSSPSTVVFKDLSTFNLFSSIEVAIEYSMTSILASF